MYTHHIVLDFEMNPVPKENAYAHEFLREEIIEIGAVKIDSSLQVVDRFNAMVRPEYCGSVSTSISSLTGIYTSDVAKADVFEAVLADFSRWIGSERARVYSWSNNDFIQLERECSFKEVEFPENMKRWLDFQAIYPRLMGYTKRRAKTALHIAAKENGIRFDTRSAHRALYDAEKTAELLIPVLSGEYRRRIETMRATVKSEVEPMTSSMDTVSGGKLAQLLQQMMQEQEEGGD